MAESPGGHTELSRDLSLFTVVMVGVGAMIGAGFFVASQWGFTLLVNRSIDQQNRRIDQVKRGP